MCTTSGRRGRIARPREHEPDRLKRRAPESIRRWLAGLSEPRYVELLNIWRPGGSTPSHSHGLGEVGELVKRKARGPQEESTGTPEHPPLDAVDGSG